ncbi:MAG TPA: ECF-type sigma factor [Gemmataceae bacterium]|nr:ECF-type sigma factor [Gemmataceae bacterium]
MDTADPNDDLNPEDVRPAAELLPELYAELRRLAESLTSRLRPGQTLQPTALVHEAYLRLVDGQQVQQWNSRGHFFGAAAEAMRRILIEAARSRGRQKRGGDGRRLDLEDVSQVATLPPDELFDLNDAIDALAAHDAVAAELVKLRFFAGLSIEEAAESLGVSRTTGYGHWTYARAWLFSRLHGKNDSSGG